MENNKKVDMDESKDETWKCLIHSTFAIKIQKESIFISKN